MSIVITGLYTDYNAAAAAEVLMLSSLNSITDKKFLTVNAMKM